MINRLEQSKALASDVRLSILKWLADPDTHFPHQITGTPSKIGVCVTLLTSKLHLSQPTVSRHLELLQRAGFVDVNKIGRWSFFKRNENTIAEFKAWFNEYI